MNTAEVKSIINNLQVNFKALCTTLGLNSGEATPSEQPPTPIVRSTHHSSHSAPFFKPEASYNNYYLESLQVLSTERLQIIFDIDNTLVMEAQALSDYEKERFRNDKIALTIGEDEFVYYLLPGVVECINYIRKCMPNTIVSFFSAGSEERNLALLSQLNQRVSIKEKINGQEGIIVASRIDLFADSLIQKGDFLVPNREQTGAKNLNSIAKVCFSNVIMIDDSFNYACSHQKDNWLIVPRASRYYDEAVIANIKQNRTSSRELKAKINLQYRQSYHYYAITHLFYALGVIYFAVEKSKEINRSVVRCLARLQSSRYQGKEYYEHAEEDVHQKHELFEKYYIKGAMLLQQINADLVDVAPFPELNYNLRQQPNPAILHQANSKKGYKKGKTKDNDSNLQEDARYASGLALK